MDCETQVKIVTYIGYVWLTLAVITIVRVIMQGGNGSGGTQVPVEPLELV